MAHATLGKERAIHEFSRLVRNVVLLLLIATSFTWGIRALGLPPWTGWFLIVISMWGTLTGAFSLLMALLTVFEHPFLSQDQKLIVEQRGLSPKEDSSPSMEQPGLSIRWKLVAVIIHPESTGKH
jgi:hypothetical protein